MSINLLIKGAGAGAEVSGILLMLFELETFKKFNGYFSRYN
jgi:hypothetical protein